MQSAAALRTPTIEESLSAELSHFGTAGNARGTWSPERILAATVLVDALMHVRNNCTVGRARHEVNQDLRWINSNCTSWPFSFVSLCESFGLDPGSVRAVVRRWLRDAGQPVTTPVTNGPVLHPGAKVIMLGRSRRS